MEENKTDICPVFLFILTGAATAAAGYLYGKEYIVIVHNVILALLGAGALLFLLAFTADRQGYDYDNGEHKVRFLLIFSAGLILAVILPLLPAAGWPYLAVYAALALFSNMQIGITSGSLLLMLTVLNCADGSLNDFFMYFISGMAGVLLFQQLDETYKVGTRIFISLLVLFTSLSAGYVLFVNEIFSAGLFLIPVCNLSVTLILLMAVLEYFSAAVIHKHWDRYRKLNDPECPLLAELKEKDKEEYLHAVHTGYLCDKAARKLGLDAMLVKAGGYYHRIGTLKGENTWENIERISGENHFPPELTALLKEYNDKERAVVSKEAAVIMFADRAVSVIRSLFRQNAEVKLNYPRLFEAICRKIIDSGKINASNITMEETERIKNILLEEKLYYDFLR